ncbi:MAG: DUF6350 family protein [Lapillicoccus sp.]
MSVVDRARPTRGGERPLPVPTTAPPATPWWVPVAAGALPASGIWLLLALPALILWVVTAHTSVGWLEALGVASAVWFLGQGAPVGVGDVPVTIAPLGLWLLALVLTARSLGRLLDHTERTAPGTTWPALLLRRVLPGFAVGYAAVAVLVWLLALAGPARPHPLGLLVCLVIPVLAASWCLVRRYAEDREAGPVGSWLDQAPRWLARALVPGVHGGLVLLGTGVLLLVVMLAVRFTTVTGLHAAVGAGVVGGVLLTLGQLLLAPNLAVWGVAWLAGPGFQVAAGSPISLAGATPGLLPLLPVLGALPSDGSWSRWLLALLLVPVLGGVVTAWLACRGIARLASWRTKLATSVAAAAVAVAGLTLLSWLGSGAVGVDRLSDVGSRPLLVGVALLGELLVGAAAYVAGAQLWIRLRHART